MPNQLCICCHLVKWTQDEISVLICFKLFNDLKITNISILVWRHNYWWIGCMPKLCSSCFTLVGQDNYMQKYSWPLASWTWCYNTTGQWPCRLIHNFIFRCFQGGRGVSSNSISTFFRFMEGFGPFLTLTSNIGFWGPKQKQKNKN